MRIEGVASGQTAVAPVVLTGAAGCEETGGGVAVAGEGRWVMGFVAWLQTSVDRTGAFQRLDDPTRATGMAVAVGVAVPTPVAAGMGSRTEQPVAYLQA